MIFFQGLKIIYYGSEVEILDKNGCDPPPHTHTYTRAKKTALSLKKLRLIDDAFFEVCFDKLHCESFSRSKDSSRGSKTHSYLYFNFLVNSITIYYPANYSCWYFFGEGNNATLIPYEMLIKKKNSSLKLIRYIGFTMKTTIL